MIILNYDVIEQLYESGNSLVYRALDKDNGQSVILKMLTEAYPSPARIAWFRREYERTSQLQLDCVIGAYGLRSYRKSQLIMVLEDLGGKSLDILSRVNPFATEQVLDLAIKIADGLGLLHQQQIIHKDINPSNIVLNPETGQLKLIDFGISVALNREDPTFRNPNTLEGTLAYMSPEQTGRMNRAIDYRTDLYSLGVSCYQLLTGQLPFLTADPMELVHAHIAVEPVPVYELAPVTPALLSDIVMKLMAKNAEDRYQSAFGLKADLELLRQQLQPGNHNPAFALAQNDISERFQLSQKLYGRDQEIATLLASFERVTSGNSEMMLVSGYAGIGKSALVREIYKPITRQHGYFIAGKFDQFHKDIPYESLIQAFHSLLRQLLTESDQQIAAWRSKLQAALGPNGRIIIDVIPEVETIIGPQPEIPVLESAEAQNRFNQVLLNFIQVFTQQEQPLVLFLDDLQWADSASLKLLQSLMSRQDDCRLLLIGTYRDNEVSELHPLKLTTIDMRDAGVAVYDIHLLPLTLSDLQQLIADMLLLSADISQIVPLAQLVHSKTHGNPFFVNAFLKSLYENKLLEFDHNLGSWRWNVEHIQAQDMTDNVVEFLSGKIQKLDPAVQEALKLAACIGSRFELPDLAMVHQKSPQQTATDLLPAVMEELVLPVGDSYKLMEVDVPGLTELITVEYRFAHDRIQQAAYALLPQAQRQSAHWRIGEAFYNRTAPTERERKIFDIVNQMNLGIRPVQTQAQQDELACLNLIAGKKAKNSAAYQPACNYLDTGLALLAGATPTTPTLLNAKTWDRHYEMALALSEEAAEAAYFNGHYQRARELIDNILQHTRGVQDQTKAFAIDIQVFAAQDNLVEGAYSGLRALKSLGIELPENPQFEDIVNGLQQSMATWEGKQIESLIDLPEMTDAHKLATLKILARLYMPTFNGMPQLWLLVVFSEVRLSLRYGLTPLSSRSLVAYGLILCSQGMIDFGYQFGQLAMRVLERFNARDVESSTVFMFNFFIRHWQEPVKDTIPPFLKAYQRGLETGDLEFAALNLIGITCQSLWSGKPLLALEQEAATYSQTIQQLRQALPQETNDMHLQMIRNLAGLSEDPVALIGDCFDEREKLPFYRDTSNVTELAFFHLNKLILHYLFGNYQEATQHADEAIPYLAGITGMLGIPVFYQFDSLAQLAQISSYDSSQQETIYARVAANQEQMKTWSDHAPMNFLHRYYLVAAELARVQNKEQEAREYYDKAIDLAQEYEYLGDEALANELAGRFYIATNRNRLAYHYLHDAHYTYQRWGSQSKVAHLQANFSYLAHPQANTRLSVTTSSIDTDQSALDLSSVLKASQAISSDIELKKLLANLLRIIIENAGAQYGFLLLEKDHQWLIEAAGVIDPDDHNSATGADVRALQPIAGATGDSVPNSIINYVARTKTPVVLDDARQADMFAEDPYIRNRQPKSVLCVPIINQGKLTGIFYLGNDVTIAAFSSDRLEILELLSAQAAISIENARLYDYQLALNASFSRFVPKEMLRFLNKDSIIDVELGDQILKEMAMFCSDIRGFTTLSETMAPQDIFDFINSYLGQASPVVRDHNGLIVKYMGDGLMAVFPERAEDALQAALETLQQLSRFNRMRQQQSKPPISIGIGLHSGMIMLGMVGDNERMQSDFLSDAVNLTSRLEGLTRDYGAAIIISRDFLNRLDNPDTYHIRYLGKTKVKGRQTLTSLYEVLDGDDQEIMAKKLTTERDFQQALNLYYDNQFANAVKLFTQVTTENPHDKAARFYLNRCNSELEQRTDFNTISAMPGTTIAVEKASKNDSTS